MNTIAMDRGFSAEIPVDRSTAGAEAAPPKEEVSEKTMDKAITPPAVAGTVGRGEKPDGIGRG